MIGQKSGGLTGEKKKSWGEKKNGGYGGELYEKKTKIRMGREKKVKMDTRRGGRGGIHGNLREKGVRDNSRNKDRKGERWEKKKKHTKKVPYSMEGQKKESLRGKGGGESSKRRGGALGTKKTKHIETGGEKNPPVGSSEKTSPTGKGGGGKRKNFTSKKKKQTTTTFRSIKGACGKKPLSKKKKLYHRTVG